MKLKVLVITNMYPSIINKASGTFIREQVDSLKSYINPIIVSQNNKSFSGLLTFALKSSTYSFLHTSHIVHAHYGFHSGIWPTIFTDRPLVITFHGSDAYVEPGRNRLYGFLQRQVVKNATHVIAVSNGIRKHLINELGAKPNNVSVIPCGVNTQQFCPRPKVEVRDKLGIPQDAFVALFVGRLTYSKGIDLLEHAASRLPNVLFYFIGLGNPFLDLPNCNFIGEIDNSLISDWINSADVLLLPSRSEGTPVVILESLACGVPVICSDVGGCREIVSEGQTGFLIPPGQPCLLIEAIKKVYDGQHLDTVKGRNEIIQHYDLEIIAKRLFNLYESLYNGCNSMAGFF